MNDLEAYAAAPLAERVHYATALAAAGLLPAAYHKQPANVLVAIETGLALGLHPMAAIQGIHVISGRPVLGSSLIGSLVRRAGHRLRVAADPDGTLRVTATIRRRDDPDYEYAVTWTMERAATAGLLTNPTWKRYPLQMLKARATAEVARDACPEVLAGLYSDGEAGDFDNPPPPAPDDDGTKPRRLVQVAAAAARVSEGEPDEPGEKA